jgi:hypothetical protein
MTVRTSDHPMMPPGGAGTLMQSIDVSVRMLRNTALVLALSVSAVAIVSSVTAAEAQAGAASPEHAGRPFAISVDGVPVAGGSAGAPAVAAPDEVDVKVKFDGLDAKPILNVSTIPPRRSFAAGERIEFLANSNYPDWIARMELRILAKDGSGRNAPSTSSPCLRMARHPGRCRKTAPMTCTTRSASMARMEPSTRPCR